MNTLKRIALFGIICGTALAQGMATIVPPGPGGSPSNQWPDNPGLEFNWDPSSIVLNQACMRVKIGNVVYPVSGVPVVIRVYATQSSGYHAHETPALARPNVTMTPSGPQTTGPTGCFNSQIQMDDYAGWWTIEADFGAFIFQGIPFGASADGNNFYFGNYYTNPDSGLQSKGIPYPDNPAFNAPQMLSEDEGHSAGTRIFGRPIVTDIANASTEYRTQVLNFTNVIDRLSIWRGSLPDGGLLDDISLGSPTYSTPIFQVPLWEEHDQFNEVDIPTNGMNFTLPDSPGLLIR